MKKNILLLFAALLPLVTHAQTKVEIGGIWYNLDESAKQAEVTYKGDDPYYDNDYSGSITIPATVTHNGVAYSVTSIGDEAFFFCRSLTAITLPEGVTSIKNGAFSGCSSLTDINIPEGVTSIGGGAFSECSSLTDITIPEGVTSIKSGAFSVCSSLTAINIPEGVTSIEKWAFLNCSSLTDITIPEGVTSIGDEAFRDCYSLTTIVVAKGNKVYDSRNGCNAIIETNSNTLIQGCSATIIPEGVTSIGDYAFSGCSSLTTITIPEGVTSIGGGAFRECSNLTTITLPEGVTSIGKDAFWYCSSLTSITIPEGVTSIGEWAFSDCYKLRDVYCYAESVPSIATNAFDGYSLEYATLHVPASAINNYKATAPWSSFGTIVCLTDEDMSIEQLTNDNSQQTIYDLCGRRVATPTKDGIYIVKVADKVVKIGM